MCEKCPVCGHNIEFHGGCSDFCATATLEEKRIFLELQPGEYGVFPCADCGCIIEGDYGKGACCRDCAENRQQRYLQQIIRYLTKGQIPEGLAQEPDGLELVKVLQKLFAEG